MPKPIITWKKKGHLWWTRLQIFKDGVLVAIMNPHRVRKIENLFRGETDLSPTEKFMRLTARLSLEPDYKRFFIASTNSVSLPDLGRFERGYVYCAPGSKLYLLG